MDGFQSYDHRPRWFYKTKAIVCRVKADSWFTCVFRLKCPSRAMGNSAVIWWRLIVHSGKCAFFDKQRFSFSVPLQFSWSCFETYISFHLSIKHAVFRITSLHNARVATARLTIFDRLVYIKMEFNSTRDILIHHNDHHSNVKNMVVLTSLTCNRCLQREDPHLTFKFVIDILQNSPDQLDNGNDGCSKSQRTGVIPTREK